MTSNMDRLANSGNENGLVDKLSDDQQHKEVVQSNHLIVTHSERNPQNSDCGTECNKNDIWYDNVNKVIQNEQSNTADMKVTTMS